MRYVYAHFPINVNIDKNAETGCYEVEIRYVPTSEQHPAFHGFLEHGSLGHVGRLVEREPG